jgi:hypothetical protein
LSYFLKIAYLVMSSDRTLPLRTFRRQNSIYELTTASFTKEGFIGRAYLGQVKSTRNRRACMSNLMTVEEAKAECKDRSKWKEVISYPKEKRAWCYECMYEKCLIYYVMKELSNIKSEARQLQLQPNFLCHKLRISNKYESVTALIQWPNQTYMS